MHQRAVNYVGLRGFLTHWAPLLAETSTTVIVGYLMNWVALQEDGLADGASSFVPNTLAKRMMNKVKVTVRRASNV